MKTTTLNKIRSHNPCKDSYTVLLKSLKKTKPDDEPLSFKYILETLDIEDAMWCMRTLPYREFCLFSADIAETVLHIFEANQPEDSRPREAIEAIRKFHSGEITEDQLEKAADAARDTASDATRTAHTVAAYAADSYAADVADVAVVATYTDAAYATNAVYNAAAYVADAVYVAVYAAADGYDADVYDAVYDDVYDAAVYVYGAVNAYVYGDAAKAEKWKEIETLFLKHFC